MDGAERRKSTATVDWEWARRRLIELGPVLLALTMLLAWFGPEPFPSLRADIVTRGEQPIHLASLLSYLIIGGLASIAAITAKPEAFLALLRPINFAVFGWLLVSVATSQEPGFSARRLGLTLIIFFLSASVIVLPRTLRQFSVILGGVALFALVSSYLGGLLIPDLAIHQSTDFSEPLLAGDWRGIYWHKNVASSLMVIFIFTGLFVARAYDKALGGLIVALAAGFMFLAAGKTAASLVIPTLILAPAYLRSRSGSVRLAIALVPVAFLNLFSVGSVIFPPIGAINAALLPDPSFTGRTEIWRFAIDKLQARPIFGYGFEAFWQTPSTMYGGLTDADVANSDPLKGPSIAEHAHNAYLDLAVTTGVVGLALAAIWLVLMPMRDIARAQEAGAPPALLLYFTQIWLFSINFACLEAMFFKRTDPVWFAMLMAVNGLAMLRRFSVKA